MFIKHAREKGSRHLQLQHNMSARAFFITILTSFFLSHVEQNLISQRSSLAQLPLQRLLHVKQALEEKEYNKGDMVNSYIEDKASEDKFSLRSEWTKKKRKNEESNTRGEIWDQKEGKNKDFSSLFQSTVTILSFLAFGGYLLCLLVHAVKGKGSNTSIGTTTMTTAPTSSSIIGRKRKKRAVEEKMLRELHLIAEAYAKYNAVPHNYN